MRSSYTLFRTGAGIVLLLSLYMLCSCKKENDPREGLIAFSVNDAMKEAKGNAFVNAVHFKDIQSMQISGDVDGAEGISIAIGNFKGLGEYTGNDFLATYIAALGNTAENAYLNTNGSVRVTSFSSDYITIVFQFEAKNYNGTGVTITKGTIQAKVVNE